MPGYSAIESGHGANHRRSVVGLECCSRAIAPHHQHDLEVRGAGGGDIDGRIAAVKRVSRGSPDSGQSEQRGFRSRLPGSIRRAADNHFEKRGQPKIGQNLVAQELRLVGTDRQSDPALSQHPERLVHAGERQIVRHSDAPVNIAKLLYLGGGIGRMAAHHRGDHRRAPHRIHFPDQHPVSSLFCSPAFKHPVNDGTRKPGAINKRAVQIENNIAKKQGSVRPISGLS